MASIAAAGAAAAALGVWYTQRKPAHISEFTEPPKTWGDAVLRMHEVVRISWKEALSKLGIWRLDHLLAIRHLSNRDMTREIAEDVGAHGVLVEVRARAVSTRRVRGWRPDYSLERGAFPAPRLSPPLRLRPRAHPHLPLSSLHAQGGPAWDAELAFVDLAMRYNRLLRGARTVRQIADKLDLDRAQILMSQLQPAILRPAYILVRDVREKQLFFVIRGTHSVRDTVTSLTAHSRPHHAIGPDGAPVLGRAHAGFLSTARWLARHVREDLAGAMRANPGYRLTIVGHSLGAGTAVILTQILRELEGGDPARNPFASIRCLAFACPSCLSRELSESCRAFITSVVAGADVVPYVSFSKVSELQAQIVAAAWEQQVLKKWRETTEAMAAHCARPRRPRRGRAAARDYDFPGGEAERIVSGGGFEDGGGGSITPPLAPFAPSLRGLPASLTCGLVPRRRRLDGETLAAEEAARRRVEEGDEVKFAEGPGRGGGGDEGGGGGGAGDEGGGVGSEEDPPGWLRVDDVRDTSRLFREAWEYTAAASMLAWFADDAVEEEEEGALREVLRVLGARDDAGERGGVPVSATRGLRRRDGAEGVALDETLRRNLLLCDDEQ